MDFYTKMASVLKELEQKLEYINKQNDFILGQLVVIKGIIDTQEKGHVIADEKALRVQDQVIRTYMNGKGHEVRIVQ